jgi:DNA-binding CsgD family transcriptional regulator
VALHLPHHRHFLLGVDRRDALSRDEREVTRLMGDLQLLAVHAQEAALRLLTREQPPFDEAVALTPRELEVLKFTMDGLTAAAIGDRLAISIPTVNFHMRNLREKLGASSKHQAVLRALSLGLL